MQSREQILQTVVCSSEWTITAVERDVQVSSTFVEIPLLLNMFLKVEQQKNLKKGNQFLKILVIFSSILSLEEEWRQRIHHFKFSVR